MKIISFAYTTPALLAGCKTVTRRYWKQRYAQMFDAGELVQAWDKNPRNGGKRVATIRLTQKPYLELLWEMPKADYEAEGFAYLHANEINIGMSPYGSWSMLDFEKWRLSGGSVYVVRFELVEVWAQAYAMTEKLP